MAISTPEKTKFLAAHLGALQAGAVSLPLNPRLTRDELHYCLEDSGAAAIVAGGEQRPIIESLQSGLPGLRGAARRRARARRSKHVFRPGDCSRCPMLDALQLGHNRPAQGGGAHAREPCRLLARP